MQQPGRIWQIFPSTRLSAFGLRLLAIGALAVAGCGGGSSMQKTTPQPPSTAATSAAVPKAPAGAQPVESPAAQTASSPAAKAAESPVPSRKQVTSPYAARKEQINILMAATAPEMSLFAFTVTLGKLVTEKSNGNVNVTVSSAGGSPDSLRKLLAGDFQISTIGLGNDAYMAYTGTGDFADKPPASHLRALFSWAAVPQMMAVRKDRNINTLQDLQGKRFATGRAGSASEKTIKLLLDENGIQFEKYSGGLEDITRAAQDGEIAGWNQSGPSMTAPDGNILSIQAVVPLRFLSLTPEERRSWEEKHPDLPIATVPPNVYPDQNYPIDTIVFTTLGSTTKDLPEDVAYLVTQTAIEDQQAIAASFPPYRDIDVVALTLENATIPLHKGAARYFQDIGATIPDQAKPID